MAVTTAGTSNYGVSALGGAGLVGPAYDRYVEFALRSQPLLRGLADKRPVQATSPGSSVVLQIHKDLAQQTGTLTDGTDFGSGTPTTLAGLNTTPVTITLAEYGNVVATTRKFDALSLSDVDPAVANIIAFNMADSLDKIVANTMDTISANVSYVGGTSLATVPAGLAGSLNGATVRRAATGLRANNAVPRWGLLFGSYVHPEVAYDLRAESGTNNFEDIRKYNDDTVGNILTGVTGIVHGSYFIETPRCTQTTTSTMAGVVATATATGTSGSNTITFSSAAASKPYAVGQTVTGTGIGTSAVITAMDYVNGIATLSVNNSGAVSSATISSTTPVRVFNTYMVGQQALAEAVAIDPHVVVGPVVDALMRNRPIGWYGLLGWSLYRPESSWLIRSSATIHST
jgi:N4-gp56 family major capsid protein